MDVKPVYQLVSVSASLAPAEAEQLLAELDSLAPTIDPGSVVGQLHTALAGAASTTQQ